MRANWWWFRVVLLGLVGLGLGAYLAATTHWSTLFSKPAYEGVIKEGDAIVESVYRFKGECGIWPEYLEDLAPEYLPRAPGPQWFYELQPAGAGGKLEPMLSTAAVEDGPRAHVGFDFAEGVAGGGGPSWRVFGATEGRVLRVGRPGPATKPAPREVVARKELAELNRRIGRESDVMEHRAGKAALLMSLGREAEARRVIGEARERMPQHFWPRLARASLDSREEASRLAAIQGFMEWVAAQRSFTHFYYGAWLQRKAGDVEGAVKSMEEAIGQEIRVGADDAQITAYYLWDMARWAIREQKWRLAIAICDAWEKAGGKVEEEKSFLVLRAAARLASGDVGGAGGAEADLKGLPAGVTVWARNVDGLREAVRRNDRGFRYDPGPMPAEFDVFVLPE